MLERGHVYSQEGDIYIYICMYMYMYVYIYIYLMLIYLYLMLYLSISYALSMYLYLMLIYLSNYILCFIYLYLMLIYLSIYHLYLMLYLSIYLSIYQQGPTIPFQDSPPMPLRTTHHLQIHSTSQYCPLEITGTHLYMDLWGSQTQAMAAFLLSLICCLPWQR
jgi:hypothetical protein